MKGNFTRLVTMMVILGLVFSSSILLGQDTPTAEAEWIASEQYPNDQVVGDFTIGSYVDGSFSKAAGSNPPKYYSNSMAVRLYAQNTLTITPLHGTVITTIEMQGKKQGSKQWASMTAAPSGTSFTDPTPSLSTPIVTAEWKGEESKPIVFTVGGSGQRCLISIKVTYISTEAVLRTLTYYPNGGVGEPIEEFYTSGTTVIVRDCPFYHDERVFKCWTTEANGSGTSYYPEDQNSNHFSMPANDVTLYAQWDNSTDISVNVLTPSIVNASIDDSLHVQYPDSIANLGSYYSWKKAMPNAESPKIIYKGKTAKKNGAIQMNSGMSGGSAFSGIVTTYSDNLKATKVKVVWNAETSTDRTLNVYGKATPYTSPVDLYGETQGTLIGTIQRGQTELTIEGNYPYIGLRSNSGAVYFNEIRVIWKRMDTSAPIVLFEPTEINLGNVVVDQNLSVNFTVSQANLTDAIYLQADKGELSLSSIEAGAGPTQVTWSYTPMATTDSPLDVSVTATSGTTQSGMHIRATVLDANAQKLHVSKAAFVSDNTQTSACINLEGVQVVGQAGQRLYLQDEDAGLLLYGNTTGTFEPGYTFSSGYLQGTYENYNGIIQLKNFTFVNPQGGQGTLNPILIDLATVMQNPASPASYDARFVQFNDVYIDGWTLKDEDGNNTLAFYDRFQSGYAAKTAPETTHKFTVKGVVNAYYSNQTLGYQISPLALTDISTSEKAAKPAVSPAPGSQTAPVSTTNVLVQVPLDNAGKMVAYYTLNGAEPVAVTTSTYVNFVADQTEFRAWGKRDFYQDSEPVTGYYKLPEGTYTVQFSINGVINEANNVRVSGQLAETQTPTVTVFGDFGFLGWSTSPYSTEVIPLPYDVSESRTLYAVYYKGSDFNYTRVRTIPQVVDGEYVIVGEGTTGNYVIKNAYASNSPTAYTLAEAGLTVNGDNLEGDMSQLSWSFRSTSAGFGIASMANLSDSLYIIGNSSTGVRVGSSPQGSAFWTITDDLNVSDFFNMRDNDRYLFLYEATNGTRDWRSRALNPSATDGSFRIRLYKKTAIANANAPRYTRIFWNETASDGIDIVAPAVVPSGYYLDMNGHNLTNTDAVNFLIEDGASYKGNVGIAATVQKNIVGYDVESEYYDNTDPMNGWYLLTSPMGVTQPSAVTNLLDDDTPDNYDLYGFNQAEAYEWQNYKSYSQSGENPVAFGLESALLYANKNDVTLTFSGNLAGGHLQTLVYESGWPFAGWNLIGNPYTCLGYLQQSGTESQPLTDYYRLHEVSEGGRKVSKLISTPISTPVNAMEGVFVHATATGQQYGFSNSISDRVPTTDYLNITVSSQRGGGSTSVLDEARVRFGNGSMLGKFSLNGESSSLYIPQSGKEFAVVCAQSEGELPLCFKAAVNGTYTLRVDASNAEMDYLHLIDNKTGADVDLLAPVIARRHNEAIQEAASYTFDATTNDYAARFKLVFKAEEGSALSGDEPFAYFDGSAWVVNGTGNAIVQVVDVMGRVLYNTHCSDGSCSISANRMAQGVYVLRVISGNNVRTQKIVVR